MTPARGKVAYARHPDKSINACRSERPPNVTILIIFTISLTCLIFSHDHVDLLLHACFGSPLINFARFIKYLLLGEPPWPGVQTAKSLCSCAATTPKKTSQAHDLPSDTSPRQRKHSDAWHNKILKYETPVKQRHKTFPSLSFDICFAFHLIALHT